MKSCPVARRTAARAGHHSNNTALLSLLFFPHPPTPGTYPLSGLVQHTLFDCCTFGCFARFHTAYLALCIEPSFTSQVCFCVFFTIRAFRDCSSFGLVTAPLGQRPASRRQQSLPASRNKKSVV